VETLITEYVQGARYLNLILLCVLDKVGELELAG
jgi:hypothetical protein